MKRLTILAKANADVRDSLYAQVENGIVAWNGINSALAGQLAAPKIRVLHETMTRSDAVAGLRGAGAPAGLDRTLPLGPFKPAAQFSTRLYEGGFDAVVLSIQADVMHRLARHRADGHLFLPHGAGDWDAADREWLISHYDEAPPLAPEQSMHFLARLARRVRRARDVPILIYNLSPVLPWERIHDYRGTDETLGERIRRFNLALIGLSRAEGLSIIDVESIVARLGVAEAKRDAVILTARGCAGVAAEVVRVLGDLGCLARGSEAA
jgi:hypothetical protein